jgi:hypothetical protein
MPSRVRERILLVSEVQVAKMSREVGGWKGSVRASVWKCLENDLGSLDICPKRPT